MTPPDTRQLAGAALLLVPALLLGVMAPIFGRARRTVFPDVPVLRWLPHPTWFLSLHYLLSAGFQLLPPELHHPPPAPLRLAYAVADVAVLVSIAGFRQLLGLLTSTAAPPDRRWLALNWGPALGLAALVVLLEVPSGSPVSLFACRVAVIVYAFVMGAVMIGRVRRIARPGAWRPGGVGGPRVRDVAIWGGALALTGVGVLLAVVGGGDFAVSIVHAAIGLVFAIPPAAMMLGTLVRGMLFASATLAGTAAVYLAAVALRAAGGPALHPVVDLGAIVALVLVLLPGQLWARRTIDRVVFHRSRQRTEALHAFLQTLAPELGVVECCRRALDELTRVMQLHGAAVLLEDGTALAAGSFSLERLAALWPRGAAAEALPARLVSPEFNVLDPALREALVDAGVLGMVAVVGPRRRWGHVVATIRRLGTALTDEDIQVFLAFADQLGLVLDAAELLARAVGVERSLAHAEKLAAIGETAARIAHEIRNPVTAARSLAQQLAREPASPANAEHASLILAELERVERQVGALLRFSRREDLRPEPTDLGELVRTTLDAYRPRLEAAGIEVALDSGAGIVAPVDREKVRQVLVNLIENAIDALADGAVERRLRVAVAGLNGTATVDVADTGPGVPAEAATHLFEPFFSLKAGGTGLGLAIAKRTVEAHGGSIDAGPAPGGGMAFRVRLPLARAA
jgi:signal transduction histidine kinase